MDLWSVRRPVGVGAITCSLTALIGAYLASMGSPAPVLAFFVPLLAAATMALGILIRRPGLVTTAGSLVLVSFLLAARAIALSGLSSAATPVTAAGAFVVTQLGWWAIDLTSAVHEPIGRLARRGVEITIGGASAGVLALVVLQAARITPGSGLEFAFVGAGGVLGFLVLVVSQTATVPTRLQNTPGDAEPELCIALPNAPSAGTIHGFERLRHIARALIGSPYGTYKRISRSSLTTTGLAMLACVVLDAAFVPALAPVTRRSFVEGIPSQTNLAPALAIGVVVATAAIGIWLRRVVLFLAQHAVPAHTVAIAQRVRQNLPEEWTSIADACGGSSVFEPPSPNLTRLLATVAARLPHGGSVLATGLVAGPASQRPGRRHLGRVTRAEPSEPDSPLQDADLESILQFLETAEHV